MDNGANPDCIAQLSQAIRLTVTGSPAPPYLAIVTRQLAVAEDTIEAYANDDCPDDVKNEAAIRFVGYLLEASRHVSQPTERFHE